MIDVWGEVIVGDPAREVDAGGDPLFLQGGLDRLLQLPFPSNEHAEVLLAAEDRGEGLGEVLDAFLPAQPADVANKGGAVAQVGSDSEGVEIEEMPVGDDNFVAVFFELVILD